MNKTNYDIFISYRRDGGGATAGRINDMLTADGYYVSYDVDTLREGRFDEQLLKRIEECQDFILVVDKNCFTRTIDPATNPKDDWLWQELSYALRLKKNVIPVLLAGASFPKNLPKDIDNVRYSHGPKCVHEYFDSFYSKLKDFLHAYPRMAKSQHVGQVTPSNMMPCLKLKADMDCIFYLDGEEHSHIKAGIIQKIPLAKGEYELMFVSEDNDTDSLELEFEMPELDKLMKVNLREIMNSRVQKETEAKRLADEKREAQTLLNDNFDKQARKQAQEAISEGKAFLEANAKKPYVVTTKSGLQYHILKEGKGRNPKATDKVRCHYEGTLINGTIFDSSYQRGEPADFPLNGVIPGWTEGVQLMKEGSIYRFFIPYLLGYGERGAGSIIPPYSTLIFDVELIKVL